jgi:phage shock protein A
MPPPTNPDPPETDLLRESVAHLHETVATLKHELASLKSHHVVTLEQLREAGAYADTLERRVRDARALGQGGTEDVSHKARYGW